MCARLKVCRHRHNLKQTKASHLHLLLLPLLLLQHRAAIIVISKAATAFPAFVMAAVELAIGGGGVCCGGGVQAGCRHVPAVFHCCYFYLHTQLFHGAPAVSRIPTPQPPPPPSSTTSSSSSSSASLLSAATTMCAAHTNIVDINGTNRRPASLHKRKCRVVSVSLAVGERGRKQAGDRVYQRQTNKRPQLQRVNATAGIGDEGKGTGCCVALRTKSL